MVLNPALWQVVEDYFHITIAYWWVMVPGVLMPLRDVLRVFKRFGPTPKWVELTVIFVCLFLAQFLAFRRARIDLAIVVEDKKQFSMEINSLHIQLDGKTQQLQQETTKAEGLQAQMAAFVCPKKPQSPNPTFSVQNPTGSIVNQASPNLGSQTVYNTPPARSIDVSKFADELGAPNESVIVLEAGTSDDIGPLLTQLVNAFHEAGWVASTTGFRQHGRAPQADGLECYTPNPASPSFQALMKAFDNAHLHCTPIGHAYDGIQNTTILVGRNLPSK